MEAAREDGRELNEEELARFLGIRISGGIGLDGLGLGGGIRLGGLGIRGGFGIRG